MNWSFSLSIIKIKKRPLVNAYKNIDFSASLDVHYLVHISALWRALVVNFAVFMKFI